MTENGVMYMGSIAKFSIDEQKKEYIEHLSTLYKLKKNQRFEVFAMVNKKTGELELSAWTTRFDGGFDTFDMADYINNKQNI
jgi:hypothetical protein